MSDADGGRRSDEGAIWSSQSPPGFERQPASWPLPRASTSASEHAPVDGRPSCGFLRSRAVEDHGRRGSEETRSWRHETVASRRRTRERATRTARTIGRSRSAMCDRTSAVAAGAPEQLSYDRFGSVSVGPGRSSTQVFGARLDYVDAAEQTFFSHSFSATEIASKRRLRFPIRLRAESAQVVVRLTTTVTGASLNQTLPDTSTPHATL